MSLAAGDRIMARGQTGTVVRKRNDMQWVVRFDVEGDFRPKIGQELIQQEAIIFVGEITKLDGTLP
jgi:hypothetical protein